MDLLNSRTSNFEVSLGQKNATDYCGKGPFEYSIVTLLLPIRCCSYYYSFECLELVLTHGKQGLVVQLDENSKELSFIIRHPLVSTPSPPPPPPPNSIFFFFN